MHTAACNAARLVGPSTPAQHAASWRAKAKAQAAASCSIGRRARRPASAARLCSATWREASSALMSSTDVASDKAAARVERVPRPRSTPLSRSCWAALAHGALGRETGVEARKRRARVHPHQPGTRTTSRNVMRNARHRQNTRGTPSEPRSIQHAGVAQPPTTPHHTHPSTSSTHRPSLRHPCSSSSLGTQLSSTAPFLSLCRHLSLRSDHRASRRRQQSNVSRPSPSACYAPSCTTPTRPFPASSRRRSTYGPSPPQSRRLLLTPTAKP